MTKELIGSPKQIEWATSIKSNWLKRLNAYIVQLEKTKTTSTDENRKKWATYASSYAKQFFDEIDSIDYAQEIILDRKKDWFYIIRIKANDDMAFLENKSRRN